MRDRERLWVRIMAIASLLCGGGLLGCVGGGGGLPGEPESWEAAPGSLEPAPASGEPSAAGLEPAAPGAGTGTGFVCGATYVCDVPGDEPATIATRETSEGCEVEGVLLESDGRLVTKDGKVVGTWKTSSSGIDVTVEGQRVSCTRS